MVVFKESKQDRIVRQVIDQHISEKDRNPDSIMSQIKSQWHEDQNSKYAIKVEHLLFAIACVMAFCAPFWVI